MGGLQIVEFSQGQDGSLREMTLEQLWDEAAKYGRLYVFSSKNKSHPQRYRCEITFETSPGSTVEAESEFGLTITAALIGAIERSREIVKLFKGME